MYVYVKIFILMLDEDSSLKFLLDYLLDISFLDLTFPLYLGHRFSAIDDSMQFYEFTST
jgi:hypothetical protein